MSNDSLVKSWTPITQMRSFVWVTLSNYFQNVLLHWYSIITYILPVKINNIRLITIQLVQHKSKQYNTSDTVNKQQCIFFELYSYSFPYYCYISKNTTLVFSPYMLFLHLHSSWYMGVSAILSETGLGLEIVLALAPKFYSNSTRTFWYWYWYWFIWQKCFFNSLLMIPNIFWSCYFIHL